MPQSPVYAPEPAVVLSAQERIASQEAALRASERRLTRVIEGSEQGFWDWNLITEDFSVSPRFETMLGYEPGEMVLTPERWVDYVDPEDLAKAFASIQAHLAGEIPSHILEFRCRAKTGEWRWILTRGRVVEWTADGRPMIMSGTHTDITDRKAIEMELGAYRSELVRLLHENDRLREDQRKEIARDLHDQIGAELTALRLRLAGLLGDAALAPRLRRELDAIQQLVAKTSATAREIGSKLRPPLLDDLGLVATCRWYLKEWAGHARLGTSFRAAGVPAHLPEEASTDIFRAYQELLNNVAKHAQATRVTVRLTQTMRALTLSVADDGRGFDTAAGTAGLGLIGVRERVARHGGRLRIEAVKSGCRVTIDLPPLGPGIP